MSYGYFQGQEPQALAYYKKLLESETDGTARQRLAELVAQLQKIVDENQPPPPTDSHDVVQNAVAA